jgi:Fe-S cluster assembly iron-binding protein IscA
MALDESTDGLDELESNGISAYIDPRLNQHITYYGDINIDYVTNQMGQSGYRIAVGPGCEPDDNGCSSCG